MSLGLPPSNYGSLELYSGGTIVASGNYLEFDTGGSITLGSGGHLGSNDAALVVAIDDNYIDPISFEGLLLTIGGATIGDFQTIDASLWESTDYIFSNFTGLVIDDSSNTIYNIAVIPEPQTMLLPALMLGLVMLRKFRRG